MMNSSPHTPAKPLRSSWRLLVAVWLPFALWMALIYAISAQPEAPGPGDKGSLLRDLFNYSAHACSFALLALLARRAMRSGTPWLPRWMARHPGWAACIWSALYAISDEYHQSFVPGRTASIWDLGVDLAGILGMLALLALWQPRQATVRRFLSRRLGLDRG
jgi:VanZ family protein